MADYRIIRADVLSALTDHDLGGQFDAAMGDPPYGLRFMGKRWDHGVPSAAVWSALLRHLRPGAAVAMFGGPRTYHRLASTIEDGGAEIRDAIFCWTYSTGWPKPGNVSKSIDKRLGAERPAVGENPNARDARAGTGRQSTGAQTAGAPLTTHGSPEAERFDGYHANLAPAVEPVCLARKPLDGTLADNALRHGLAGLNIDGCRVGDGKSVPASASGAPHRHIYGVRSERLDNTSGFDPTSGRWPSNLILTCDEAICGPGDPREIQHAPGCHVWTLNDQTPASMHNPGTCKGGDSKDTHLYGKGLRATERPARNDAHLGASRFFYCAKVSKAERGPSAHPCMKPVKLTEYLARLLLPPPRADGQPRRILVPFSGSGSEMIGALAAGWDEVVGIEWDAGADNPGKRPDYWADVAEYRIAQHLGQLRAEHCKPDITGDTEQQLGLFGGTR